MAKYIKREKSKKAKKYLLGIIISFLIILVIALLYQMYIKIDVKEENEGFSAERTVQTVETNENITTVLENTTQCVVGISKLKNTGSTIFLNDGVSQLGLGSGVIITENGYILSNEHVTGEKYSTCYVTLEDGRNYKANVVWSDSNIDLSISKINMTGLPYANLGNSENIRIGQSVYAIGNPIGFEFQRTVTAGIISAVDRTIKIDEEDENGNEITSYMDDLIQTDATINKGNSGGPLINENGEIIGVTSVKITSAEGIGFAVPINIIKPIIDKYKTDGKFEEATLGIFAYDKNIIPYIDSNISLDKGIYVAQIVNYSPASKANLKVGDVIEKIDDVELNKMSDLRRYIYQKNTGDKVNLTIYRNKKEYNIEITLGKKS